MASSIMFTHGETPTRPRSFANDSDQYVHYLGCILHSEPIVQRCIEAVVSNTLNKTISCMSVDGHEMATGAFHAFVNRHYMRFARDAVRMFFVLGFVVWRVRKIVEAGGVQQAIPEIVPLGCFSWKVQPAPRDKNTSPAAGHRRGADGGVDLSKRHRHAAEVIERFLVFVYLRVCL